MYFNLISVKTILRIKSKCLKMYKKVNLIFVYHEQSAAEPLIP